MYCLWSFRRLFIIEFYLGSDIKRQEVESLLDVKKIVDHHCWLSTLKSSYPYPVIRILEDDQEKTQEILSMLSML